MREDPVGFFDSGIGGTCILQAFQHLCPNEKTVYLADTEHCPYGNRSPSELVTLCRANVRRLLEAHCKMIVVACNTATAAAIDDLRTTFPEVPFVGIEPALKPAAMRSTSGIVGVLATAGTFQGRLYNETKARFARNVTVLAVVADEFVTIVERAAVPGTLTIDPRRLCVASVRKVVRAKIEPLLRAGADRIVLGCTHFPHLRPVIEEVCAGRAEVIDPSDAVARQARQVLAERELLNA